MLKLVLLAGTLSCFLMAQDSIRLITLVTGLSNPVEIQSAKDGSGRLFVLEQVGRVRIIRDSVVKPAPFLNIAARVSSGGERGLLGIAFPPDYARKQYFYVNYTNTAGNTVISRFRVTADRDVADPASEQIILTVQQPFANHNGGQLQFGPDGFLYIGLGDGGSANDPQGNGQNRRALLGKMLRIDVESDLTQVRVPDSNPFVNDSSYDPRIWALGLRNPWRYSFDRENGDLWIGDVGQNRLEEVDFQPASSRGGENYGWAVMEGTQCVRAGCNASGLVPPVHEYGRNEGGSITGGYVYRGSRFPDLRGTYIYADYVSGRIWGLTRDGQSVRNRLLLDPGFFISTFGQGEDGELYLADHTRGIIYQIASIESPLPGFTSSSVVNAASYQAGLTPGSLVSLFGTNLTLSSGVRAAAGFPLPTSLNGVSILVNGQRVPLYAVAGTAAFDQVNFQVPWDLPAGTANVVVERGGVSSDAAMVAVQPSQPGIFTSDGSSAIAVRSDYTLVRAERPLRPGEAVYLYATGLGPVDAQQTAGQAAPIDALVRTVQTPVVTLNGASVSVTFSGLAPGLAGVYQVNFTAPANPGSGPAELRIVVGGVESPAVRIPVQSQ
jgi:uncharacterized protein (TIGR03437 family)